MSKKNLFHITFDTRDQIYSRWRESVVFIQYIAPGKRRKKMWGKNARKTKQSEK